MTTGTLIRQSRIVDTRISDVTVGCSEELEPQEEEESNYLRQQNSPKNINTGQ